MTVDLVREGQRTLQLGSAYFPTTGASSDERQTFHDEIARFRVGHTSPGPGRDDAPHHPQTPALTPSLHPPNMKR